MSLSTLVLFRRRSAAAILWSVRNPCVIQADSEPPGRHTSAPGTHVRRTHFVAEGSFVSSGEVAISSTLVDFPRHLVRPHGIPSYDVSLFVLLSFR
jgi:hypothetical protein